jgi:thiol-disulfide isomerase/thioredoxin
MSEADPPAPPATEAAGTERRRGRTVALVALAVAATVTVLVVVLALGDPQRGTLIGRSAVGNPAPAIRGITLTGDAFDLDDHRGRWVVVNFFATWCTGCIIEHPELVTFSERHAGGDAIVVTVAFDDSPDAVRGFFERAGGGWPVLAGDVGSVPVNYGVTAVPETYLVSPAGYVVDKLVGATGVTADELDARIAALEALATSEDDA